MRGFLVIEVPMRPFSLNAERSEHRFARAKRVKGIRELAKTSALDQMPVWAKPFFESAHVEVEPIALDRRFRQDIGNCYPSAKACIDGFVDAGILRDDTDKELLSLKFYPHQYGRDIMRFTLTGLLTRSAANALAELEKGK